MSYQPRFFNATEDKDCCILTVRFAKNGINQNKHVIVPENPTKADREKAIAFIEDAEKIIKSQIRTVSKGSISDGPKFDENNEEIIEEKK